MDEIATSSLAWALLILLAISAYFSGSETAMMSINRYRLRHLVKQKHRGAARVEAMLKRPDRLIGLILIGNNLVNIAASAIATIIGIRLFGTAGVAIATLSLTLIVLLFAEVTPKTVAALYPERIAFPSSLLLKWLLRVLYPVVWLVNMISGSLLWLLRISPKGDSNDSLSREELRTVVNEASGMIPGRHQEMLLSILDLEQVTVDDVMIPRNEIVAIDINNDWDVIAKQITRGQHTRILLYRDTIDEAVGFAHARDAVKLFSRGRFDKESLLRAAKPIYFIPEGTPLNVQLLKFQHRKERIGLVVDEYGDIQGLVTLEDILEEIVGDFTTSMAPEISEEIQQQPDGSVLIDGGISVRDLNKEMKWNFPTDGPRTLSGLIVEVMEEIPDIGVSLRIAGYPIEVIEVRDNMVKTARVLPEFYRSDGKNTAERK